MTPNQALDIADDLYQGDDVAPEDEDAVRVLIDHARA